MSKRYLALSMELIEFSEAGTYKQNNIHSRFNKKESMREASPSAAADSMEFIQYNRMN